MKIKPDASAKIQIIGGVPTVSTRRYYSRNHLAAAVHSVAMAKAVEESDDRPPDHQSHQAYVFSAIISSVAYLEASINEVYQDVADGVEIYVGSFSAQTKELIDELRAEECNLGTLQKYQLALICCDQPRYEKGAPPYQAVSIVIKVRNALIHPWPTTQAAGEDGNHRMGKMLKNKFRLNQLMAEGNAFFPDKCLGYGCAKWALDSCTAFVQEFDSRVGLVRT